MSTSMEKLQMMETDIEYRKRHCLFDSWWIGVISTVIALFLVTIITLSVFVGAGCRWPTSQSDTDVSPWADVRLPENLHPTHYAVELEVYLDPEFYFDGKMNIEVTCAESTRFVVLHSKELDIDQGSVTVDNLGPGSSPRVADVEFYTENEFLIITLTSSMQKGSTYSVRMSFTGDIDDSLAGLYRSSYTTTDGETRWLAVTQFQATDARKVFPCFDEPALKATFDITLGHEANYTALSNMPVVETSVGPDGRATDRFAKTPVMSTYLIAMIISDFSHKEETVSGKKFRVWAREEAIDTVDYALQIGPGILDYFEDYYGVKYPLEKTDLVALPDFGAGAMENWGLITFRETALLFDPNVSTESNKQRVAVVIAHELAHQWFGNLVSPDWWSELWLNEGFASYVEYQGTHQAEPTWKMDEYFVASDLLSTMELDSLTSSHAIYLQVSHPDQINEIFDSITYGKGASIIRMLNNIVSEDVFKSGLNSYLKTHEYSSTTTDDLWHSLQEAVDEADKDSTSPSVKTVMDTWTLQMGYPVITIDIDNSNLHASQKHFVYYRDPLEEVSVLTWYVPLTYTDKMSAQFDNPESVWMEKDSVDVDLVNDIGESNWLLANVKMINYYRVNYPVSNWVALIAQLNTNHSYIPVENRAGLIDDVFSLSKGGLLNVTIPLQMSEYLVNEEDYIPWKRALTKLSYIGLMLRYTSSYGKYAEYVLSLVSPHFERLGWEAAEDHQDEFTRIDMTYTACSFGHPWCVGNATQWFAEFMLNPDDNTIAPNIRRTIYCTAVRLGGESVWDFVWEKYLSELNAGERALLRSALSCTEDSWLLYRFLYRALDVTLVRAQDFYAVVRGVSSNSVGHTLTWDFMRGNWDHLTDTYGAGLSMMSSIVSSVTNGFNEEFELSQLEDFIVDHEATLGTATRALEQAVEKTKINVQWMGNNVDDASSWFQSVDL